MNDELEDHDRGLSHDLPTLLSRRIALGLFGGAGLAAALAACTSSGTSGTPVATEPTTQHSTSTGATTASTEEIPEETAGPYPADGSNGPDVLAQSGIVRSDIRSSFGALTGTAEGVPLTVRLKVIDASSGAAMKGAAVYAWHCDRDGQYSLYGVTDQNYLRGVQEADASGTVTFRSIFPAAYSGRWPHIHFEVYPSLADATSASNRLRTSQLALPKDACDEAYATSGYEQSMQNLAQSSLDSDMVFSDGYSLQLATVTGSVAKGYIATLRVPV